ncbi:MAG TPA: serine/threonine-protein kinase [Actinomycetota bacterium]|jgi:serine/threonine protein kinase|nr:serine/threonine-protein kinase [Actinomycetota bacterium]
MDREDVLPTPPTGPALPTVLAERYQLDRSLGNGGMGEVFEATDLTLHRSVAVKLLSPSLVQDEPARARFLREARALAQVNSPHVVAVYDAGEDDERPYLVMELVEGTTLEHELERAGRLEPPRAVAIAKDIASGLASAHEQGIVHRDVKPSNVFLTPSDAAKIGDFGIARLERPDATLTLTGQTFGSPPYVAPEQATGGKVDARADLYSLGCVLFQMLVGRRPFSGDDAVSLVYQHVHTTPPRVDSLHPEVPVALGDLVAGLMAKDPDDRPDSAEEVQRALESVPTEPVATATATATVPVTATATVPVTATAVLPRRAQAERRQKPWWPLVAGIVGVVVLLALTAAAILARGDPAAAPPSPTRPASIASSSASTSTSSSPSVPLPQTPETAAAALFALTQRLQDTGAIDHKLAEDIQHAVDEAVNGKGHGHEGDASNTLKDLKDKVSEAVDHGTVSAADGGRLIDAIDQLEQTLSSDGD